MNKIWFYQKLFLLFCVGVNLKLFAQDLFDLQHTRKYALFLLEQKKYNLAIPEIERWHFFSPNDDTAKYLLLKAYRKNNFQTVNAKNLLARLYPDFSNISTASAHEYALLLLYQQNANELNVFLKLPNKLQPIDSHELALQNLLLQKLWKQSIAYGYSSQFPDVLKQKYANVFELIQHKRNKSPWLAASLSAIIPGTGKIYTGYWKDGLIAFLSIGMASWQTYSGFKTDGKNSIYGYAFLTFGSVLYLSNIYGSFKSAKVYNKNYDKKIAAQAMDILELNNNNN